MTPTTLTIQYTGKCKKSVREDLEAVLLSKAETLVRRRGLYQRREGASVRCRDCSSVGGAFSKSDTAEVCRVTVYECAPLA